jgi:glycosyltransferase involved in cell wall biosynthesis
MRFNIITNIKNGVGLEREYRFLRTLLESYGHQVDGVMFNAGYAPPHKADVNLFLEVLTTEMMRSAKQNWIMPNSEWWFKSWSYSLGSISKVLCKTPDCYRIWCRKVGKAKCVYTGFESLDLYHPKIVKQGTFLHLPGRSNTRQTEIIAQAWRKYALPYQLTVVSTRPEIRNMFTGLSNVYTFDRIDEESLVQKMNENLFFLHPSRYEGFGHALHEALGCGAVVLTTDAPPMNEVDGVVRELLIPVSQKVMWSEATANIVTPAAIAEIVHLAANLGDERCCEISTLARAAFLIDRDKARIGLRRVFDPTFKESAVLPELEPEPAIEIPPLPPSKDPLVVLEALPDGALIAMRMTRNKRCVKVGKASAIVLFKMGAAVII